MYRQSIHPSRGLQDTKPAAWSERQFLQTHTIWINCASIERYWGSNPDIPSLQPRWEAIKVRTPHQGLRQFKRILRIRTRNVFFARAELLGAWFKDTRNWYYDPETRHCYVFMFGPCMVWVQGRFVQELCAYRVDHLFCCSPEYAETNAAHRKFTNLRNRAEHIWKRMEKKPALKPSLDVLVDMYDRIPAQVRHPEWERQEKARESAASHADSPDEDEPDHTAAAGLMLDIESGDATGNIKPLHNEYKAVFKAQQRLVRETEKEEDIVNFYKLRYELLRAAGARLSVTLQGSDVSTFREQRQLAVRRLFWRLFQVKFGMHYADFFVNQEARMQVYSKAPDLFGPAKRYPESIHRLSDYEKLIDIPTAEKFYANWRLQNPPVPDLKLDYIMTDQNIWYPGAAKAPVDRTDEALEAFCLDAADTSFAYAFNEEQLDTTIPFNLRPELDAGPGDRVFSAKGNLDRASALGARTEPSHWGLTL